MLDDLSAEEFVKGTLDINKFKKDHGGAYGMTDFPFLHDFDERFIESYISEASELIGHFIDKAKAADFTKEELDDKKENSFGDIVQPSTASIDAKLKAMQQQPSPAKTTQTAEKTAAKTKSTGIGM